MICRFSGPCKVCGGRIEKGEECGYDAIAKKIYHHACQGQDSGDEDEQRAIADRLGFQPHLSREPMQPVHGAASNGSSRDRRET